MTLPLRSDPRRVGVTGVPELEDTGSGAVVAEHSFPDDAVAEAVAEFRNEFLTG